MVKGIRLDTPPPDPRPASKAADLYIICKICKHAAEARATRAQ
ncbi:hypothetical protein [Rhizobium aegyptiacum]